MQRPGLQRVVLFLLSVTRMLCDRSALAVAARLGALVVACAVFSLPVLFEVAVWLPFQFACCGSTGLVVVSEQGFEVSVRCVRFRATDLLQQGNKLLEPSVSMTPGDCLLHSCSTCLVGVQCHPVFPWQALTIRPEQWLSRLCGRRHLGLSAAWKLPGNLSC